MSDFDDHDMRLSSEPWNAIQHTNTMSHMEEGNTDALSIERDFHEPDTPGHHDPECLVESLEGLIRTHMVKGMQDGHRFLPQDQLDKIMTAENIRRELRSHGITGFTGIMDRTLESYKRIFAILCLMGKASSIIQFIEEGISDNDLPMDSGTPEASESAKESKNYRGTSRRTLHSLSWRANEQELFKKYQWQILAPVFVHGKDHRFEHQAIVPFLKINNDVENDSEDSSLPREGGFSVVRRVAIHPAHWRGQTDVVRRHTLFD
jgi:hypothetical protein